MAKRRPSASRRANDHGWFLPCKKKRTSHTAHMSISFIRKVLVQTPSATPNARARPISQTHQSVPCPAAQGGLTVRVLAEPRATMHKPQTNIRSVTHMIQHQNLALTRSPFSDWLSFLGGGGGRWRRFFWWEPVVVCNIPHIEHS